MQRRLFEVAGGGLAHRILPDAERTLGDQRLGNAAGIAVHASQFTVGQPDDDFILGGDHLEQGNLVGGEGGLNHDALHDDAGKAEAQQQNS